MTSQDSEPNDLFQTENCLNCGSKLQGAYCGTCGQKRAQRLGTREVKDLAWEQVRRFEFSFLRACARVCLNPGRCAREFVLGARVRNIHPFKLYLSVVVILLLVLARINYLATDDANMARAYALVQQYSKWSFSIGIIALFLSTCLIFWRKSRFNWVEHLVLATYVHAVVLILAIISMSPLLLVADPELIRAHRAAAARYLMPVEFVIVFYAVMQFFVLDWRRQWWWAGICAITYIVLKSSLIWLYARVVVWAVLTQLA